MSSVFEIVTEKIVAELEKGHVVWQRPWRAGDAPRNIRGTRYNGINVWLLEIERRKHDYKHNVWMTFNQVKERGGDVKGERGTLVVYWKVGEKINDDGEREKTFMLRYYTVFNVAQVKGFEYDEPAAEQVDPIAAAESVVKNMQNAPELKFGGDSAYYATRGDYVQMPRREQFKSAELFYAVLFHELGHSTGHASRLGRFDAVHDHTFASNDYSKEELVAEMTSAFVCAEVGIQTTLENSAAYIASWLAALNNDKSLVVKAAGAAAKAAQYIVGESAERQDAES